MTRSDWALVIVSYCVTLAAIAELWRRVHRIDRRDFDEHTDDAMDVANPPDEHWVRELRAVHHQDENDALQWRTRKGMN